MKWPTAVGDTDQNMEESVSRGYAEVYLPELLTSMAGGCSSELLRCITLDPKQHSSSTSGLMGGPGGAGLSSAGGGAWDFASSPASSSTSLTIRKPTVTAEFHFMERILDDPFSVCKGRSGVGSPTAHLKVRTAALTSPASSSDSSLSQTDGATVSIAESGNVLVTTNVSSDRSPHGSKDSVKVTNLKNMEFSMPEVVPARLFSEPTVLKQQSVSKIYIDHQTNPIRRLKWQDEGFCTLASSGTHESCIMIKSLKCLWPEVIPVKSATAGTVINGNRYLPVMTYQKYGTASHVGVQIKVSHLKNPPSLYAALTSKPKTDLTEIYLDTVTSLHSGISKLCRPDSFISQIVTPEASENVEKIQADGNEQHESRLQRSTSIRGSRLFEPAYENLRMADINAAALSARQHSSKGYRRKSSVPRVLSGLTSGGCGNASTSGGFGLLGPSSQLAGVVAGLTAASVESSEASVDPSTAAAVASALAVAAATGRSTSASAPLDRQGLVGGGSGAGCGLADSFFEGSMANLGHGEHGEPLGDTVVRYAAPAANVAESLGTFSAQPPLKRPDATGTKLMNLFKSKKKHQPSGMARLLYLQNLEGSEFDAISTEGYQRIVHGDQLEKQ
ncbi:hypothetical protein ACTXT7_014907 [Hymenolepis weldensis]